MDEWSISCMDTQEGLFSELMTGWDAPYLIRSDTALSAQISSCWSEVYFQDSTLKIKQTTVGKIFILNMYFSSHLNFLKNYNPSHVVKGNCVYKLACERCISINVLLNRMTGYEQMTSLTRACKQQAALIITLLFSLIITPFIFDLLYCRSTDGCSPGV